MYVCVCVCVCVLQYFLCYVLCAYPNLYEPQQAFTKNQRFMNYSPDSTRVLKPELQVSLHMC